MIIDYDPAKDEANRIKHGVPLSFGLAVLEDESHLVLASSRAADGEDRYRAIGLIDGRLWTIVYVECDEAVRLISVRRSNAGEQGSYDRHPG